MRIVFNSPRILAEFTSLSPKLKKIIFWTLENAWPEDSDNDIDFVFTCIGRTKEENAAMGGYEFSPHVRPNEKAYFRAADSRNRTLNTRQRNELVSKVNAHFIYDPDRPFLKVVISNDKWSTGPHFHWQIHPKTRERHG